MFCLRGTEGGSGSPPGEGGIVWPPRGIVVRCVWHSVDIIPTPAVIPPSHAAQRHWPGSETGHNYSLAFCGAELNARKVESLPRVTNYDYTAGHATAERKRNGHQRERCNLGSVQIHSPIPLPRPGSPRGSSPQTLSQRKGSKPRQRQATPPSRVGSYIMTSGL